MRVWYGHLRRGDYRALRRGLRGSLHHNKERRQRERTMTNCLKLVGSGDTVLRDLVRKCKIFMVSCACVPHVVVATTSAVIVESSQ